MTLVTIWSIVMESNCGTSNSISEVSCYEAWHRFLECYDLSNHVEVIDQIVDEHNRRLSWLAKLLDLWFFWPKNRSILERLLGSTGTNSWELSKLCTHRFSAKKGHVCQLSFSPEVTYRLEPYKLARMNLSNARREMLTPNTSSKYRDWEIRTCISDCIQFRVSNHLSVVSSSSTREGHVQPCASLWFVGASSLSRVPWIS